MSSEKSTSKDMASKASEALRSQDTGKGTKTVAGSVLSQANAPEKHTSEEAATAASKVMQDGRTSADSKSVAASALSQKKKED